MTLQQAIERRPKKIDLNILPDEYRPPKKSYLGLILSLVVFVLACALVVVIVIKLGVDSDIKTLDQNLSSLQQQLTELQANQAEAEPLKAQIAAAQAQLAGIEADYEDFIQDRLLWSQIIDEIIELLPGKKITLASISTEAAKVTIVGTATKRMYVYDYALELEDSDFFEEVDFTFGDCPETSNCDFTITAPFTVEN